ncbi:hypothetical protein ACMDCR_18530 [Labrys okinawensis]|uniref:hypothetical protein n=1 Tax=Labrys okinawensis TaxID=346911 RepID=UPI0039BD68FA
MAIIILTMLASAAAIPALAAPDPAVTAQDVTRDLGLQPDLPGNKNEIITPETRAKQAERPRSDIGKFMAGDFVRFLLYGALLAGIVFAIWTMRDRLPALGRRRLVARDQAVQAVHDAAVERMVVAQMEADELARQGRIAEAMHALLLRSLIEVRRRLNVSFADSLTSREILKVLSLPEVGKLSLADIIRRVEVVYFGEHPASERDYAACRDSYERLTQAMQARLAS